MSFKWRDNRWRKVSSFINLTQENTNKHTVEHKVKNTSKTYRLETRPTESETRHDINIEHETCPLWSCLDIPHYMRHYREALSAASMQQLKLSQEFCVITWRPPNGGSYECHSNTGRTVWEFESSWEVCTVLQVRKSHLKQQVNLLFINHNKMQQD